MTEEAEKKPKKDMFQFFRRLKDKWHSNHIAYRDVLDFDEERKRFQLNRYTIAQYEITPDDLLIDGEKWKVFQTPLKLPRMDDTRTEVDEDGTEHTYLNPTPISWNLYYESDALNDASTGEFRSKIINPMILALIIGGGILLLLLMLI